MVEPPAPPPPPGGPPPPGPPPGPPSGGGGPEWSEMGRKVAGARGPDLVLLVSGAVFVVATFMPWYRATIGRFSASDTAWGSGGLGVLAALLGIGATVVAVTAATGSKSLGSQSAGLLAMLLSIFALLFTFLRLVIRPPGAAEIERVTQIEISRGIGLWLAFAAAIVMSYTGYRKYRQTAV